jgi:hypothetical protein
MFPCNQSPKEKPPSPLVKEKTGGELQEGCNSLAHNQGVLGVDTPDPSLYSQGDTDIAVAIKVRTGLTAQTTTY